MALNESAYENVSGFEVLRVTVEDSDYSITYGLLLVIWIVCVFAFKKFEVDTKDAFFVSSLITCFIAIMLLVAKLNTWEGTTVTIVMLIISIFMQRWRSS